MKSMFTRDFWTSENLRRTWEYRVISFSLRFMLALAVIMYLLVALPSLWPWAQQQWVRLQDASRFEVLLDRARDSGDHRAAFHWLRNRPLSETAQHAALIDARAGELPALFMQWPARAAQLQQDAHGTEFWNAYYRYRLRYDILRCGNPELIERMQELNAFVLQMYGMPDPLQGAQDENRLPDVLQSVLDYDAQKPAANPPQMTCFFLQDFSTQPLQVAPPQLWAGMRHTLRLVTEDAIAQMRGLADETP